MVLGKIKKEISKKSSVQGYESAWLGHWTQLGNNHGDSKELIRPEESGQGGGVQALPFPMFKVSQTAKLRAYPLMESTKPSFHGEPGSSSKNMSNRMASNSMYAHGDNAGFRSDFPFQEKTTQNLLELIQPVRTQVMVDSVHSVPKEMNLAEENGHQLLKGSKLKGKLFDLFPNLDHQHKGSSKETKEDEHRKNASSAETDILEIDTLQMIHFTGSISSSSTKGKGRNMTEIPDMNEEPPLVLDREHGETSNSATQSMNVDYFQSRECKRVRLEPELEPSSRWVKRLKTNVSYSSGHDETKSLEEPLSGQKGNNNLFLEILKSGINNLQPRNQNPITSHIKNLNKGEEITLLHPWIQRWCKKKATSTDKQDNQKEFEKRQYPSIAAMALMGKALSGLNPYGLRKTESLMVWNARDIR